MERLDNELKAHMSKQGITTSDDEVKLSPEIEELLINLIESFGKLTVMAAMYGLSQKYIHEYNKPINRLKRFIRRILYKNNGRGGSES